MTTDDSDWYPEIKEAMKILPAWFIPRMMSDMWAFGLLLSSGQTLAIETIEAVWQCQDGSVWIDVQMLGEQYRSDLEIDTYTPSYLAFAPTSRVHASINCRNIVAAFELKDT